MLLCSSLTKGSDSVKTNILTQKMGTAYKQRALPFLLLMLNLELSV